MAYEHRISVDTPEGVRLELPVAGLGSRLGAAVLDAMVMSLVVASLFVAALALMPDGTTGLLVGGIIFTVVFLGYDTLFEVRRSGRTPGKSLVGIRVVQRDGSPVTFRTSAVRNLLRLVDVLPGFYSVGVVAIIATRDGQRLGDLAAGTVVVRERRSGPPKGSPALEALPAHLIDELDTWDTTAVTQADTVAVTRFLDRRGSFGLDARTRLSGELADRLRGLVVAPSGHHDNEVFLQQVLAARAARSSR